MFSHAQGGVEIPRRNDARSGRPKITFYVERNQGFIFDKEHELSRNKSKGIACPSEPFHGSVLEKWGEDGDVSAC
jgi:hypothetical protein